MIRPLLDHIVVNRDEVVEYTGGGIFLPFPEKVFSGKVLATGPGRFDKYRKWRMETKPGDQVMFCGRAVKPVHVDGEDFLIMQEADLVGIVR